MLKKSRFSDHNALVQLNDVALVESVNIKINNFITVTLIMNNGTSSFQPKTSS